ncbi:MAG TPA: 23S rRNA (guanosine(2251)-2'-O)-methyltransferase RlmB [Rhizomicrobium sp.]|jgi:23S rRNA (guanosine2251-2'-O)-methyltransferase
MTRKPTPGRSSNKAGLWLYGIHAVRAALENRQRKSRSLVLTKAAAEQLGDAVPRGIAVETVTADQVSRLLPPGAVHQGVALSCDALPRRELREILAAEGRKVIVVLDQISDPQNVGAILRSAAAFDVSAVIVQDRHAPPESGALAKAASGALDLVPYVQVVNIARTLEQFGEAGFWRIALGQDSGRTLADAMSEGDIALVLGSEGAGIRQLVRRSCDDTASIPIGSRMESLNVSNAAAIALYECRRAK